MPKHPGRLLLQFILVLTLILQITLAQTPPQQEAKPKPNLDPTRWQKDIDAFLAQDKKNPPPPNPVLFVGSSSIRLWKLDHSFPFHATINRGFGGSHMADSLHYADKIILPYKPTHIVLYAGDNDIAAGVTPAVIASQFKSLTEKIHTALPKTTLIYVAIKPSIARWKLWPTIQQANGLIKEACAKDARLIYLDIATPMLGDDGKPRPELFVADGLHLSPAGYKIWDGLLTPHLPAKTGRNPDNPDFKEDLPTVPPMPADKALTSFRLKSGFKIEQVAAEPLVTDPVAIAFDEDSRLFVAEMRDYSEDGDKNLGRIRMLTDSNGDGRYDQSTIFAADLSWPTSLTCYDGGVFVAAAPHLYYLKDTDGDGVADVKRIVFTGFSRSNVQGMLNNLTWGLDNRIHGAGSSTGGQILPDQPKPGSRPVDLRGRDFAFDPRNPRIIPTPGGAQHGMTFDDYGRKYLCSNSDHIQYILFDDRYTARNPLLPAPSPRLSIAAEGPQAEVFRISPVEPWRILRTRLRVAGVVQGIVEGGGRPAGYFTSATGITIYRGDAWPPEFRGNAFVGDVGGNLVHRKAISHDSLVPIATRTEPDHEFLASTDIWFRPVQLANGPDGNLYVIDMYREVIEHPASLPPAIKKHLDLTSGRDRGRIYRITHTSAAARPPAHLSALPIEELVALLAHPNGWHRDTAARLIHQRQDRTAIPLLRKLVINAPASLTQLYVIYALHGLNGLEESDLLSAMVDPDAQVRRHALILAESLLPTSPAMLERLKRLAADPNPHVRMQAFFSMGTLPQGHAARNQLLSATLLQYGDDPWLKLALLSGLYKSAGPLLMQMLSDHAALGSPQSPAALAALASQLARESDLAGAQAAIGAALKLPPALLPPASQAILKGFFAAAPASAEGRRFKSELQSGPASKLIQQTLATAIPLALDCAQPEGVRLAAIGSFSLGDYAQTSPALADLLKPSENLPIQIAAIGAIARFTEPEAADLLLAAQPGAGPSLGPRIIETLLQKTPWASKLLDAIAAGKIPASSLSSLQYAALKRHPDKSLRQAAEKLAQPNANRAKLIADYMPALTMPANPERGKTLFTATCAACHKHQNIGAEIGPNLAAMVLRGPESLLVNILDPNREVNPQFSAWIVRTRDGRTLTGTIESESASALTLKQISGQPATLPRSDIAELKSLGLSLMPEGLENVLDKQAMADLLAWLAAAK